jgi:hypothetical protein
VRFWGRHCHAHGLDVVRHGTCAMCGGRGVMVGG